MRRRLARLDPRRRLVGWRSRGATLDGGVSIVYVTHRREPRFDWFVDSLASQLADHDFEVIFVDGRHDRTRTGELERLVGHRFAFRHVPAKPTPYNGPHRLTQRDYFAAASARNTGIVYASKDYVVFVDDASVLMPGWLEEVRQAARRGYVVAGAYWKQWEMIVEGGRLVGSREDAAGRDTRWNQGKDGKLIAIGGGQFYGSSCGIPRQLLIELNGYDELCDPVGGEDYDLGLRLEWSRAPIYYSRRMLTIESEEAHREGEPLVRLDKLTDARSYMQRLLDFGVSRRSTHGRHDTSHMLLDIRAGTHSVRSIGNYYELADLSEDNVSELVNRFPRHHWFDQQPLADL